MASSGSNSLPSSNNNPQAPSSGSDPQVNTARTGSLQLGNNTPSTVRPLIPIDYVCIENQKYAYYLFGVLIHLVKYYTINELSHSADDVWEFYRMWLALDALYFFVPYPLRLPCHSTPTGSRKLFLTSLFGFWTLTASMALGSEQYRPHTQRISGLRLIFSLLNPFGATAAAYIHQGYRTVQTSPVDSARLSTGSYCLTSEDRPVYIPVLLEYADLAGLKYSFTPLAHSDSRRRRVENMYLSARELISIKKRYGSLRPNQCKNRCDKIAYIEVSHPGTIRLERVLYFPQLDAHILDPHDIVISPCPQARFAPTTIATRDFRCQGSDPSALPLIVEVFGVPPLVLKWSRLFNETRHHGVIHEIYPTVPGALFGTSVFRNKEVQLGNIGRPHHIRLALPLSCSEVGDQIYLLDTISDASGNEVELHDELVSTSQILTIESIHPLTVLPRPKVAFSSCEETKPRHLKRGANTTLMLLTEASDIDAHNKVNVVIRYRPSRSMYDDTRYMDIFPWEKTFTLPAGSGRTEIPALLPGEYSVVGISDMYCSGDPKEHGVCSVVEFPIPSVNVYWEPAPECYGVKGIALDLSFTGTPPFTISYTLSLPGWSPSTFTEKIDGPYHRFRIQPSHGGNYTITLDQLSDSIYQNISLSTPAIIQKIEQPLSAKFISGKLDSDLNQRVLNTCDDSVDITLEFSGLGPWSIELQIKAPGVIKHRIFSGIERSPHRLTVEVPVELRGTEGLFHIFMLTVHDARGCKIDLAAPGLLVNVRENKPTAKFIGESSSALIESQSLELHVLLSGRPPWLLTYRREGVPSFTETLDVSKPRFDISVTEPGLYQLVKVENRDCPGAISPSAASFYVSVIPKPSVALSYLKGTTYDAVQKSHILQRTCQATPEHIFLDLTGTSPFRIALSISETDTDGATLIYNPTFYSSTDQYRMQLQTSNAGHVIYKILHVADSVYTHGESVQKELLTFEQHIFTMPAAQFKSRKPLEQYLHNTFQSSDWANSISLVGSPPFQLQLSIRHTNSGQSDVLSIVVHEHDWQINIPTYTFRSVGQHLVKIVTVTDASGCLYQAETLSPDTLIVEVLPSPISGPNKPHLCVGDLALFDMDGSPPWRINYLLDGRSRVQEISCSPWSLPLDRTGELAITTITRETRNPVSLALRYQIYPRPSALVTYPNLVMDENHFDEEVPVNITLFGTPPFTFSYRRVTSVGYDIAFKEGDNYTVFDLKGNNYVFQTLYKGKWEVVDIRDKYCRSP